jgi:hypothetical protein
MNLHPDLKHLLERFQKRRQALLLTRGILSGATILLAGVIVAAALDRTMIFEDRPRVLIAISLYSAGLAVMWTRSLRKLTQNRSHRELARAIEHITPVSKGALLSAVELGEPTTAGGDSLALRVLHQERTANTFAKLDCRELLPWSKLRMEILTAGATVAVWTLFLINGGEEFSRRCIRLLLPTADIERFSETNITILSPSSLEGFVPEGERLSVRAEIVGRQPLSAWLQCTSLGKADDLSRMEAKGNHQYEAPLNIGTEPVDYRIKAGDASTKRHRLIPVPRPQVSKLIRHYHPPAYTGLPSYTDETPGGTIEGVEGTTVELMLKSNQPVNSGSLSLSTGRSIETLYLTKDTDDQSLLHGVLLLKTSGSYLAQLTSSTTQFVSEKGHPQEIRVTADTPPTVVLNTPEKDLILPLGDKLEFTGVAGDDFGLVSLSMHASLNNRAWQELPPAPISGKRHVFNNLWDPLELHPSAADILAVKFIVTDNKGQKAESRVIQISFTQKNLLPSANRALAAQQQITRRIEEASRQANEAARAVQEAKTEADSRAPNTIRQNQSLAKAKQALDAALENAATAREHVLEEIRREFSADSLSDLKAQAQALNRLELGELELARKTLERIEPALADVKRSSADAELFRQAMAGSSKGAALANASKEAAQARQSTLEAAALSRAARDLAAPRTPDNTPSSTATLTTNPESTPNDNPENRQTETLRFMQIHQALSADLVRNIKPLLEHSATAATTLKAQSLALQAAQQSTETALKKAQTDVPKEGRSESADKAFAAEKALKERQALIADTLESLAPALQEAAQKAHQKLKNEQTTASERLAQASKDIEAIGKRQSSLSEKSTSTRERLDAEADVLRADADIEASRFNASAKAERDLRTAAAAIEAALSSEDIFTDAQTKMTATARALQTLEAVTAIEETIQGAEAVAEQGSPQDSGEEVRAPRQRSAALEQLHKLAPQMRRAGLPEEAADAAAIALDQARKADLEQKPEGFLAAANSLREASKASLETANKARAVLQELAHSLPERLAKLAAESAASAQKTQQLATIAGPTAPPVPEKNLQNAKTFERKLDDLQKEFQAIASSQTSMTQDGRAKARDADAAAAHLREPVSALKLLKEANASRTEAATTLRRASEQQYQTASKLNKLADHFRNMESGDAEAAAKSRQTLRDTEQQAGVHERLESREKRAADLAALASSHEMDAALKEKMESLAATQKAADPDSVSMPSAQARAMAKYGESLNKAMEAMKAGDSESFAQSVQSAAQAQQEADRLSRSAENQTAPPPQETSMHSGVSDSTGLAPLQKHGDSNWGNLPQRLANDLMTGKREKAPSEYRTAVDAYFQAVAEKARGAKARP